MTPHALRPRDRTLRSSPSTRTAPSCRASASSRPSTPRALWRTRPASPPGSARTWPGGLGRRRGAWQRLARGGRPDAARSRAQRRTKVLQAGVAGGAAPDRSTSLTRTLYTHARECRLVAAPKCGSGSWQAGTWALLLFNNGLPAPDHRVLRRMLVAHGARLRGRCAERRREDGQRELPAGLSRPSCPRSALRPRAAARVMHAPYVEQHPPSSSSGLALKQRIEFKGEFLIAILFGAVFRVYATTRVAS